MLDVSTDLPGLSFVDLHSHVLPGVDDGPETVDEALAMLRSAADSGTTLIVATPHSDRRKRWDNVDSLRGLCLTLNEELESENVPLTVVLGMEIPVELNTLEQIKKGNALTLNGSAYTLVELPFLQLPIYWEEVLFQIQISGLHPVIAHPERQAQIQETPELLAPAVDRGVLAQVTAGSLVGHFGPQVRKSAETLLKKGLVHVISSDCHRPDGPRGPGLVEGFQAAAKIVGEELALQMASETPRSIVRGDGNPALNPRGDGQPNEGSTR